MPSTLKTLPVALNSSPLVSRYKLLEVGAKRCHLASPSQGNIILFLLTMVLTYTLFCCSAYVDSTPGIKWNVSDAPTFLGRKRLTNSFLSVLAL